MDYIAYLPNHLALLMIALHRGDHNGHCIAFYCKQGTVTMTRAKLYDPLRFIVQCKWPDNPFYETIAAFDGFEIGNDYARSAFERSKKRGVKLDYQLLERAERGSKITIRSAFTHGK